MAMTITIIVLIIFAAAEFGYAFYQVWKDEQEVKKEKERKETKE